MNKYEIFLDKSDDPIFKTFKSLKQCILCTLLFKSKKIRIYKNSKLIKIIKNF